MVLVACEESQAVCKKFRRLGVVAFSCDLQKCTGGHPNWHIQGDVLNYLYDDWDLIIAFPPCTYLSHVNYPLMDSNRYKKSLDAAKFFNLFDDLQTPHLIENPIPMKNISIRHYDQLINPFQFGHPFIKPTCFWLHKLPKLFPTKIVKPYLGSYVQSGPRTSLYRSKTFDGIAAAIAEQYSRYLNLI